MEAVSLGICLHFMYKRYSPVFFSCQIPEMYVHFDFDLRVLTFSLCTLTVRTQKKKM